MQEVTAEQKAKLEKNGERPAWRAGGGAAGPGSPEATAKSRYNNPSVRAKVDTGLQKP